MIYCHFILGITNLLFCECEMFNIVNYIYFMTFMANEEPLKILLQGVKAWNKWRLENRGISIDLHMAKLNGMDLREANFIRANLIDANFVEANLSMANLNVANLSGANLCGVDLSGADLSNARLKETDLSDAYLSKSNLSGANISNSRLKEADLSNSYASRVDLSNADLSEANLNEADFNNANFSKAILWGTKLERTNLQGANLSTAGLWKANLRNADLSYAILKWADLLETDLSGSNLSMADIRGAFLVETNLEGATLTGCKIYGISAWELKLDNAKQNDLVITPPDQPIITVDNLEVAQFIYLILNNKKIHQVIDTITSKTVLILGRFTPERKPILDAIKEELRKRDYLPVLFDFDKSASRDIAEAVSTLAHMARFIIADITDAKSIPAELQLIVPQLPSVPVQPLILNSDYEFALFEHIQNVQIGFRAISI